MLIALQWASYALRPCGEDGESFSSVEDAEVHDRGWRAANVHDNFRQKSPFVKLV